MENAVKPMVLGNTVYLVKKYIIDNYGLEFFEKVIKDLDPEIREILRQPIFSNKFYDVRAKVDFVTAFRSHTKSIEEVEKMTTYECDKQLGWIYGIVLKFISFKKAMELLQGGWSKHFNTGTEVGETDENGRNIKIKISAGYKITPAYVTHLEYYDKRIFETIGSCKYRSSSRMVNDTDMELHYIRI